MREVLLIATGGTIASKTTENGLSPALGAEELISYVPELRELCHLAMVQPFCLDSTNMSYVQWLGIAEIVRREYARYDAFVVTHGTDTMAYAAATLSYLIQNSPKPVVFTGAQVPITKKDSDARRNLLDAMRYACDEGAGGVTVVFDGKVIAGTRARKMRTRSFNAFASVDYPELAIVRAGRVIRYVGGFAPGPVRFYTRLVPDVFVLKLVPGMRDDIFNYLAAHYAAVIIESFGMGGIPYYENETFSSKLELLLSRGVKVIITTQVPHEGSDMTVYSVGLRIKRKYELLETYDMTAEAVVAKTMWALAEAKDDADFRTLFTTPVGRDLV